MVSSTRRLSCLALTSAAALTAVWSAFTGWYGPRAGSDIRLSDLFDQMTPSTADSLGSLLIPMLISAVLVIAGNLLWRRRLWALGGIVALTTVLLWIVRQAQTPAGLHADLVGAGPWMAASAGVAMLTASVIATAGAQRSRTEPDRLSPEWTPAAGTEVGKVEGTSEPRVDELA